METKKNKKVKVVVKSLGSSSEGNAFILEIYRTKYDIPFILLLEMGFAPETLKSKLFNWGYSVNDINASLITHEHDDHAIAIKEFVKRGVKAYAPKSVFTKYDMELNNNFILKPFKQKMIGDGIAVFGIPLNHLDTNGSVVDNLGYIITIENNFRILYITDTNYIKYDLSKYQFNIIIIETNYIHNDMYFALKNAKENNDKFKEQHYKRTMKSHLGAENTGNTLATFNLDKTQTIFLMHLSSGYGTNPVRFKEVITTKLQKANKPIPKILICDKKGNIV